jgi:hypothetical protein
MPPNPAYAEKTKVPIAETRMAIEKLLERYGATAFAYGRMGDKEALSFEMAGLRYRFDFWTLTAETIKLTDSSGRPLTRANMPGKSVEGAVEQANRTRWRELYLGIKAKLVLVEAGITTLEEEFLAQTILPDNTTFGKWAKPHLRQTFAAGKMPPMLPPAPKSEDQS